MNIISDAILAKKVKIKGKQEAKQIMASKIDIDC